MLITQAMGGKTSLSL